MPADPEAMQRMLAEMRAEYRNALPAKLLEIENLWRDVAGSVEPAEKFHELRRLAHTLAGSAKTFGLPGVTETARALEEALAPLCQPGAAPAAGEIDFRRIAPLVAAIRRSSVAD